MAEDKQSLNLINRELLELDGVIEVINFDQNEVSLKTNLGDLLVLGEELYIKHLDLEDSKLNVEGYISELKYDKKREGGILKKLFK